MYKNTVAELRVCNLCKESKSCTSEFFYRCRDGFQYRCKVCQKTDTWAKKNREKFAAYSKEWKRQNWDHICAKKRERRLKDPEKVRAKDRRRNAKLRREVIAAYGGKCTCCGEAHFEFLAIDHVNDDGAEHRKAIGGSSSLCRWLKNNGFPKEGFRILCHNCNVARAFYGSCPHLGPVDGRMHITRRRKLSMDARRANAAKEAASAEAS